MAQLSQLVNMFVPISSDQTEMGTFLSSLACPECGLNMSGSPPACSDCGETITSDREHQVLEMCQNLVKRLDGQECMVWLSSLKKLKRFLSVHHFILVQLKQKFLLHARTCAACSESQDCRECREQVQWLFNTLQPGVGGGGVGEWGEERSKVMSGGEEVNED